MGGAAYVGQRRVVPWEILLEEQQCCRGSSAALPGTHPQGYQQVRPSGVSCAAGHTLQELGAAKVDAAEAW